MTSIFDRYKDIIPNYDAFVECIKTPLPTTFWMNPLKITRGKFLALLKQENIQAKAMSWNEHGFKLKEKQALGTHWLYLSGLIQLQEEVSMLPIKILDPKPGDTVLDLCAAPGNKTAEIAVKMLNTGTVVANDRNAKRIKALGQIMRRLSIINTSVTLYDGCNYPSVGECFDKILVDAPCSCEGTVRKKPGKPLFNSKQQSLKKANIQFALLKKALRLLKPGGQLVYSTCTFAPEENEAVVNRLLQEFSDELKLKVINIENFQASEGLTHWEGEEYNAELKKTLRVWPQQNNTGGFFVALFQKLKKDDPKPAIELKNSANDVNALEALAENLEDNFSFSAEVLDQFHFQHSSKRGIFFTNKDHFTPAALELDTSGILAMKTDFKYPKPSTSLMSLLGQHAHSNVVELKSKDFQAYLRKETFQFQPVESITTGYVIISYQSIPMGLGFAFEKENLWYLQSLFPKWGHG